MLRLEDYSLIKNMSIPDELKGVVRQCIQEKAFNENVIKDEVRGQISNTSFGMNPNIFGNSSFNSNPLTSNIIIWPKNKSPIFANISESAQ